MISISVPAGDRLLLPNTLLEFASLLEHAARQIIPLEGVVKRSNRLGAKFLVILPFCAGILLILPVRRNEAQKARTVSA